MHFLIGIIGLVIVLALSFLISNDRKKIRYAPILVMLGLQFLLGFILLRTTVGTTIVSSLAGGFDALLDFGNSGVEFVFGGIANKGSFPFFLNVLMPIIFISAIIGILRYIKILPLFMKGIGLALSKVNGMGKLESYNGIASAILGQSEVFISIKKELPALSEQRLTAAGNLGDVYSLHVDRRFLYGIDPTTLRDYRLSFKFIWRLPYRFDHQSLPIGR